MATHFSLGNIALDAGSVTVRVAGATIYLTITDGRSTGIMGAITDKQARDIAAMLNDAADTTVYNRHNVGL